MKRFFSGASPRPLGELPAYLHQIDALRLLAVLVVMFHHYLQGVHFPFFGKGVILFFFLSGYFSTRQLMRFKKMREAGGQSIGKAVRVFYFRRYIRIFPMYYGILLFGVAAGLPWAREAGLWLATFTTNWYILLTGHWVGPFSPFWSLGLLEQFYLFWPLLILSVPRSREIRVCLLLVLVAILWRAWCYQSSQRAFMWFVIPWSGWDQLGLGAMTAILHSRMSESTRIILSLRRFGLFLAGPLSLFLLFGKHLGGLEGLHYVYEPALNCLFFIWLVDSTSRGHGGWTGALLSHPVVCNLGRASYSVFALHNLTVFLIPGVLAAPLSPLLETNLRWIILVPATLLVSWLAYRYVERPINRLKRFFVL
ncbi:MAG: acyltransferase family protein [Oceanipulchritudo sp.]